MRTHKLFSSVLCAAAVAGTVLLAQSPARPALDKDAEKWVQATLKKMTLDEKVGQMLVTSFQSNYTSTDSKTFDELASTMHELHIGGFHVFGGSEPAPNVLLNPTYGAVTLGQPLEAASLLNRLQAISTVPLLNTADFETGVGFRMIGATSFPRDDGVWRRGRREARVRGGTRHRRASRARSACT